MTEKAKEEALHSQGQPRLTFKPLTDETSNLHGHFGPSPSQTVGPYFHQGLVDGFQGLQTAVGSVLVDDGSAVEGERITLTGRIYDGDGVPIPDALIEVWQPGADGKFITDPDAPFNGFGRGHTRSEDARYRLRTVKPAAVAGQAPRLVVWLGMRGLLTHLMTFIYFSDEDNSRDPTLNAVPEARRSTLIATRQDTPGQVMYTFDLHMQGERETAFFDVY